MSKPEPFCKGVMDLKKGVFLFPVILSVIAIIILSSCETSLFRGGEKDEPEVFKDVFVMEKEHSLLNLPLYVAMEQGFFARQGLKASLEKAVSREEAETALQEGKINFLLAGPETGIYLMQKGSEIPVLQITQLASSPGHFLIARDKNTPFQWKNLKGKVILGYNEGDTPQLIFQYLLRRNNLLPLQDVHIVHNLPEELRPGAFMAGSGHYLLASEPQASSLELDETGRILMHLQTDPQVPVTTVMATAPYLAAQKETAQGFVNALLQGLDWLNSSDPETVAIVAAQYFPRDSEKALIRGISRLKTLGVWTHSPLINKEEIKHFQQIMSENRELLKTISPELLVDNSFVEAALTHTAKK